MSKCKKLGECCGKEVLFENNDHICQSISELADYDRLDEKEKRLYREQCHIFDVMILWLKVRDPELRKIYEARIAAVKKQMAGNWSTYGDVLKKNLFQVVDDHMKSIRLYDPGLFDEAANVFKKEYGYDASKVKAIDMTSEMKMLSDLTAQEREWFDKERLVFDMLNDDQKRANVRKHPKPDPEKYEYMKNKMKSLRESLGTFYKTYSDELKHELTMYIYNEIRKITAEDGIDVLGVLKVIEAIEYQYRDIMLEKMGLIKKLKEAFGKSAPKRKLPEWIGFAMDTPVSEPVERDVMKLVSQPMKIDAYMDTSTEFPQEIRSVIESNKEMLVKFETKEFSQ